MNKCPLGVDPASHRERAVPPPPAVINIPGSNGPGTPDQWVLAGFLEGLRCPFIDKADRKDSPDWMQVRRISARDVPECALQYIKAATRRNRR